MSFVHGYTANDIIYGFYDYAKGDGGIWDYRSNATYKLITQKQDTFQIVDIYYIKPYVYSILKNDYLDAEAKINILNTHLNNTPTSFRRITRRENRDAGPNNLKINSIIKVGEFLLDTTQNKEQQLIISKKIKDTIIATNLYFKKESPVANIVTTDYRLNEKETEIFSKFLHDISVYKLDKFDVFIESSFIEMSSELPLNKPHLLCSSVQKQLFLIPEKQFIDTVVEIHVSTVYQFDISPEEAKRKASIIMKILNGERLNSDEQIDSSEYSTMTMFIPISELPKSISDMVSTLKVGEVGMAGDSLGFHAIKLISPQKQRIRFKGKYNIFTP